MRREVCEGMHIQWRVVVFNLLGRPVDVRIFAGKVIGLTRSTLTVDVPGGYIEIVPIDQVVRIVE